VTKSLIVILIASATLLQRVAPVAGNLWIGVVGFRVPYQSIGPQGQIVSDQSTVLEPVGALVGGKWWFDSSRTNQTVTDAVLKTVGTVPAQWLPPGTELPSRWQAHLPDGRQTTLRTFGPLDFVDGTQILVVASDLKLRRAESDEDEINARAVAVAGDVKVQFFTDLDASSHPELLRFSSARMLAAERAEIQRKAAEFKGLENKYLSEVDIKSLIGQLTSTPRQTNLAKTALLQGERIYVMEGAKTFKIRDIVAILFTGAGARRDRNGALHLLGTWSYLDANEWAHENRPIAVVERDGKSCWLIAHAQEGGQTYSLTKPGQIAPLEFTSACDIK
jgi:hypothetical protein